MIVVSLVLRRFLGPSCRSEVVLGGPGRSLGVWGGLGGMWGALWDLFETSRGALGAENWLPKTLRRLEVASGRFGRFRVVLGSFRGRPGRRLGGSIERGKCKMKEKHARNHQSEQSGNSGKPTMQKTAKTITHKGSNVFPIIVKHANHN